MRLLVGLGNPGATYAGNRHNIGFMAVERIAIRHGFGPWRKRFQGLTAEGHVGSEKVLALLPQTFMNRSGDAVGQALGFFKLRPETMVVIHDELDLPPGRLKVKKGGGAGGHNGLRSIDSHAGPEYWRIRLGIGHPGDKALVHNYVLRNFQKSDQEWLDPLLDACASAFPLMAEGQPEKFMTRVALLTQPPKPEKTEKLGKPARPDAELSASLPADQPRRSG